MKKRLLCLLLCLTFVLSGALVGCSEKTTDEAIDDANKEASATTITLGVHLVSENDVSDAQAQKIEDAVNAITQTKFRTKLELHYYTEAEYYQAMEQNFEQMDNAYQAESPETEEGETTEAETVVNALGQTELKYPTIGDYQVDIFYLSGYDKYQEYFDAGHLAQLDDTVLQQIRTYMSPQYLSAMSNLHKRVYALPTNSAIGEYTYLLVNKEIMAEMNKTASDFTSLTCDEVQDMLEHVELYHRENYVPLKSTEDVLMLPSVQYWGVDESGKLSNNFSLIGGMIDPSFTYMTEGSFAPTVSLLQNTAYLNQIKTVKGYEFKGYYANEAELAAGKAFAIGYMQGGAELEAEYGDDYELIPVGVPKLTTEELYSNMFAVHADSVDLERTMNIVTYLNTNADFRNLLLYGIEGENYELVDSEYTDEEGVPYKVVRRISDSYVMDINKTGNTLIAYSMEGENPLAKEYAKKQNLAAVSDLALGFDLSYNNYKLDMDSFHALREYSEKVYNRLAATKSEAEIDAIVSEVIDAIVTDVDVINMMRHTDSSASPKGNVGASFSYVYYQWLIDNDIYVEPEEN